MGKVLIGLIQVMVLSILVIPAQGADVDDLFDSALFIYEKSEKAILLEMKRTHSEIADDDMFTLQVCGDGTVKVHYPIYMKKAGDYRFQLSAEMLQSLLQSMAEKGLFDVEIKELRASLHRARRDQKNKQKISGEIRYKSSDTITFFRASLDGYRPSGQIKTSAVQVQLSWYGLQSDANDFDYVAIDALADAERELLNLAESDRLKKVELKKLDSVHPE